MPLRSVWDRDRKAGLIWKKRYWFKGQVFTEIGRINVWSDQKELGASEMLLLSGVMVLFEGTPTIFSRRALR